MGEGRSDAFGVNLFGFLVDDVEAAHKAIEAAGGSWMMGEESATGGNCEIKYRDPDSNIFDITATGWRTEVEPEKDAAE